MTDKARWNVRTVAADEDRELWNNAWRAIKDTEGSKENKGFCRDDAWLFTADEQRMLYKATVRYACTYQGDFSFMLDMKEKALRSLPGEGAMWAILNCMKADFRRRCAAKRAALAPQAAPAVAVAPLAPHGDAATCATPVVPHVLHPARAPLANGYYTVNMGDETHVTLRLDDDFRPEAPEGSQVAAYLSGSDNTSDYTSFAFVTAGRVGTWKRFREGYDRQHAALDILLGSDTEVARAYGLAYAIESGRCARCGRLLTVETSVAQGLGPECAKKGWNA